jgi:O-methyltransferase
MRLMAMSCSLTRCLFGERRAAQVRDRGRARVMALKHTAKEVMTRLGLEVLQTRTLNAHLEKYAAACVELEACFRQFALPELPAVEQRARLMAELQGTGLSEAMYLLRCLHHSMHLDGDVCEFGVAQGATSALLANEMRGTAKNLWLFDSFEGLPKPAPQDVLIDDIYGLGAMSEYEGKMAEVPALVLTRLRKIDFPVSRTKMVAGFIESTLQGQHLPERICFAYVDLDLYAPIKTALRFVDRCLAVDGYVVVDDYGRFSAGAQTAVDEFIAELPGSYTLTLPPPWAGRFAILQKQRSPADSPRAR